MIQLRPFKMFKNKLLTFPDFFRVQFLLFRLVGINFDVKSPRPKKKTKTFNKHLLTTCLIIYLVDVSSVCIFLLSSNSEIEVKSKTALNFLVSIEVFAKMFALITNIEKIKKILRRLKKMNDINSIDNQYLIKETNVILVFVKFTICGAVLFYFIPLLTTLNTYWTEGKWLAIYTNHLYYPFDAQEMRAFFPVSLFHLCFHTIFMSCYSATDALILVILIFINQQYLLIANKFKSEASLNGEEFKQLVDQHCKVTRFVLKALIFQLINKFLILFL